MKERISKKRVIIFFITANEIENCTIENNINIVGLKYKTFMLFEKNKNVLCDFEDYCIKEREKDVVKRLALIEMFCGEKYDEENCMKKYKEGDRNHFISLLKSKRIKNKKDYISEVKGVFQTKDLPRHFYLFQSYFKGELIKTKKNITSIIGNAFSIFLGIISLVSLKAFMLLGWEFWIFLLSGIIVEIVSVPLSWESRVKEYMFIQSSEYDYIKKDIVKFLETKKR